MKDSLIKLATKHPRLTGFAAGLVLAVFAGSQIDRVQHLAAMGEQGPAMVDTTIGLLGLAFMIRNLLN